MWHMTCDTLHVTCDRWHVTCCGGLTFSKNFSSYCLWFIKPARSAGAQRAPARALGLLLNSPPFTTGRGVNSNRAKNPNFWGNALYTIFKWHSSQTTSWAFKGNALRNKSPVDHFWFRQNCWAIPGVWSGQRAQKLPFKKTHFWRLLQTAIFSWKTFNTFFDNRTK